MVFYKPIYYFVVSQFLLLHTWVSRETLASPFPFAGLAHTGIANNARIKYINRIMIGPPSGDHALVFNLFTQIPWLTIAKHRAYTETPPVRTK